MALIGHGVLFKGEGGTMKVKVGKCYYRRMGDVVGSMHNTGNQTYPFTDSIATYTSDGRIVACEKSMGDLIAEYKPNAWFGYRLWVRLLILFNV